jgi:hypothetical protein
MNYGQLMRLKCEAYSTLNDSDEDTDAEDRWQAKVTSASGFSPHNVPYISAAALYLTAIIEYAHFPSSCRSAAHHELSIFQGGMRVSNACLLIRPIGLSFFSIDIFCRTSVVLQPGIAVELLLRSRTSISRCAKTNLYMACSRT